jgi:hypothetical protein
MNEEQARKKAHILCRWLTGPEYRNAEDRVEKIAQEIFVLYTTTRREARREALEAAAEVAKELWRYIKDWKVGRVNPTSVAHGHNEACEMIEQRLRKMARGE